MNRKLAGPFLELNFYSKSRPESETFADLARHALRAGGRATGKGLGYPRGQNGECGLFGSISDEPIQELQFSEENASELISDSDLCVIQLEFVNASGIYGDMMEKLTYTSIPDAAIGIDRHPVAIWTDGQAFEFDEQDSPDAEKYGLRAYERFTDFCRMLDPDYGAITVEDTIPISTELLLNSKYTVLRDFYVSHRGGITLGPAIKKMSPGAYIE